jgi:hypothetical protein
MVATASSGSHATSTASAPSSAAWRLSATTRATGSPTKRTACDASTPNTGAWKPSGPMTTTGCTTPSRSAAVRTATTPGTAAAAVVSIPPIAAWGKGLRTNAACSRPGNRRSST